MLLHFVRRPRFEPATTGLSGKIHIHLTMAPSTWFRGSFYGIYTNGDDRGKGYQIRAWSSYASWSLFCRRFVDIQQSFSCIFHIRDGNDFSQFGRTEVNETQGYAISRYSDANQLSRGLPFHCISSSVADKSHVHALQNWKKFGFQDIIFQDLICWTEMFIWLLVASGEIPECESK